MSVTSRFGDIKMADLGVFFVLSGCTTKKQTNKKKKPCVWRLFQRGEAGMAKAWRIPKGCQAALCSPDPLPSQPGSLVSSAFFDLSTVVNGNTAPALGDPLASCQVVFVYTVLIRAHVWLHVWLVLSDSGCSLRAGRLRPLFC